MTHNEQNELRHNDIVGRLLENMWSLFRNFSLEDKSSMHNEKKVMLLLGN